MSNDTASVNSERSIATVLLNYDNDESISTPPEAAPVAAEDFARLVPLNNSAKVAFHELVLAIRTDPKLFQHHSRFLHVTENDNSSLYRRQTLSDSGDEPHPVGQGTKHLLYSGYFRLNLALLPSKFGLGWVIGSGRSDLPDQGVDLRITTNSTRDEVTGRQARLFHHQSSGVLMIAANPGKAVFLNGQELKNEQKQMLSATCMGLTIGNLTYRFEFTGLNATRYRAHLAELMRSTATWSDFRASFEPTPSARSYELKGYQFQPPSFHGTYGIVSACVKISTGMTYAVKRVKRTKALISLIKVEMAILRRLGSHPHICSLVEVFYSDGDGTSMGSREVNDVYLILEPFAPHTFHALIPVMGDGTIQKSAFHQGAQGLRYIHSCCIIHRDIKPSNLLIASHSPLRIVIADFGHATLERGSKDHTKGTISYLPPEIIALKKPGAKQLTSSPQVWTAASDVFSLGLVGLELFGKIATSRIGSGFSLGDTLRATLENYGTQLDRVLVQMVSHEAKDRPTMKDLLLKSVWEEPETPVHHMKKRLSIS